jgi:hypothetical protein
MLLDMMCLTLRARELQALALEIENSLNKVIKIPMNIV